MKLRDLRGAIRKPGNPSIVVELTPGRPMTLMLQKTPLLAELGRVYEDGAETGLTYDPETGVLGYPGSDALAVSDAAASSNESLLSADFEIEDDLL